MSLAIGNIELSLPMDGKTRLEIINEAGEKIREILERDYGRKRNWPRLLMTGFCHDKECIRLSYDLIPDEREDEE